MRDIPSTPSSTQSEYYLRSLHNQSAPRPSGCLPAADMQTLTVARSYRIKRMRRGARWWSQTVKSSDVLGPRWRRSREQHTPGPLGRAMLVVSGGYVWAFEFPLVLTQRLQGRLLLSARRLSLCLLRARILSAFVFSCPCPLIRLRTFLPLKLTPEGQAEHELQKVRKATHNGGQTSEDSDSGDDEGCIGGR